MSAIYLIMMNTATSLLLVLPSPATFTVLQFPSPAWTLCNTGFIHFYTVLVYLCNVHISVLTQYYWVSVYVLTLFLEMLSCVFGICCKYAMGWHLSEKHSEKRHRGVGDNFPPEEKMQSWFFQPIISSVLFSCAPMHHQLDSIQDVDQRIAVNS